jgi:hypothetical protein
MILLPENSSCNLSKTACACLRVRFVRDDFSYSSASICAFFRFVSFDRHRNWKTIAIAASALLVASCAARKPPPPPPPVYPPVPENSVQQLRYLPSTPYDRLETVTIEGEVGTQYSSALQDARQAAARKGGNAMILVEDKEFRRTINGRQRIVRRTIYWVVHLR